MKLLKYVKEFKFSATLGFLFKIFEAALELCVPVVMASVIDKGIAYKDTNYILKCGLVLIGLAVFGYLFALVCQWYASLTSQSVGTQLRKDMYHQINKYDGREVQVGHSYLGYIDNSRISSSWCKEVK